MFRFLRLFLKPPAKKTSPAQPEHDPYREDIVDHPMLPDIIRFDANDFYERIGYQIKNEDFFIQAFVHRSYLQLAPSKDLQSNERLEFLGDSILNFLVAEWLYQQFPEAEEGHLTKVRSRLVSGRALADCARRLHLADFVFMSPSANQSLRAGSDSILVDACEAVLAAIYLDGGLQAARVFIEEHILKHVSPAIMMQDENHKSRLLEYLQARGKGIPRYLTVNEEGPDHNPVFTVEVQVNSRTYGMGIGRSKKAAEQMAAAKALDNLLTESPEDK